MDQTGVFPVNPDQQPTTNTSGFRTRWLPLQWQPTTLAATSKKLPRKTHLGTTENSREIEEKPPQATSMTKKPTWQAETSWGYRICWDSPEYDETTTQQQKATEKCQNNNQDQWRMVRNHHWSSVDNNKNRCQPPRSTKLGCGSDQISGQTYAFRLDPRHQWQQQQPPATTTRQPPTTTTRQPPTTAKIIKNN